jgi:hypothetical protein
MKFYDTLVRGERVVSLMWSHKFRSITALARYLNLDGSLLRRKLDGQRPWYLHEVRAVAQALDTSVAYLIGETDIPTPLRAPAAQDDIEGQAKGPEMARSRGLVAGAGLEPATPRL